VADAVDIEASRPAASWIAAARAGKPAHRRKPLSQDWEQCIQIHGPHDLGGAPQKTPRPGLGEGQG